MTLAEKIALTPKLERIDSSIESCIKILEQELENRKVEAPDWSYQVKHALSCLSDLEDTFEIMKGKK